MFMFAKLKCMLGLHKWSTPRSFIEFSSNVIEKEQRCLACGKIRREIVPRVD